jgi:hypothetical protein
MEYAAISAANAPQSASPHEEYQKLVRLLIFRFVTIRTITCSFQSFRRYTRQVDRSSKLSVHTHKLLLSSLRCSVTALTLGVGKRSMPHHRREASLLATAQRIAHLLCRSMATKSFFSEVPQSILNPFDQATGSSNRILTERESLSPPLQPTPRP